jgi:hypothetical protein
MRNGCIFGQQLHYSGSPAGETPRAPSALLFCGSSVLDERQRIGCTNVKQQLVRRSKELFYDHSSGLTTEKRSLRAAAASWSSDTQNSTEPICSKSHRAAERWIASNSAFYQRLSIHAPGSISFDGFVHQMRRLFSDLDCLWM